MKTEAYYCTGGPVNKILGTLTVSNNLIYFEPCQNIDLNNTSESIKELLHE